jgi:hypothetical protein
VPSNTPLPTDIPSPTPISVPALTPVSQVSEIQQAVVTVIAIGTGLEELKAQAISYDVKELTCNAESYIGNSVTYYGRVIQALEDKALFSDRVTYTLRFAVNDNYDNVIVAKLVNKNRQGFRPLDGDWLTIHGKL